MPKVSVIIPNYNHAPFLSQRIESVLAQTFTDFEIILLDDKSTDGSREIIAQYKSHPKVSAILLNDKNSGSTFLQWEKGFELAGGEYIWIAESDDYCEPAFLEIMVNALDKNPAAGVAYCQSFRVNENGQEINDFRQWKEPHWPNEFYLDGMEMAITHFMNGRAIPNASTAVFWKEMISSDRYFTKFRYSGDIIFWLSILAKTGIVVVNQRLNYFRKHEKNVSGKASKNGLDMIEAMRVVNYVEELWGKTVRLKQRKSQELAEIFIQNQLHPHKRVSLPIFFQIIKESVSFDKFFIFRVFSAGVKKLFLKILPS